MTDTKHNGEPPMNRNERTKRYGINWEQESRKLQSQNADLVAALQEIANGEGYYGQQAREYKLIARAALTKVQS